MVSNWVSVHLIEVSVSVSISKFYNWKVSVSVSVSKLYNWKVSVSYRYRISMPAWYQYRIGIGKSGIEDLWSLERKKKVWFGSMKTSGFQFRGFFGRFFVNSRAKKTSKNPLKLSTLEARSKYGSIFLGFYYLKHEKN